MAADPDPILEARLGLLEQALDEVDKIRQAMTQQRSCLNEVQRFLDGDSEIRQHRSELSIVLKQVLARVEESSRDQGDGTDGPPDGEASEAVAMLQKALEHINKLEQARNDARKEFKEIRRWSVAGLADLQLNTAAAQYRAQVNNIRRSVDLWQAYEQELRGRGEELFIAYLDLLSSMAVRGFGIDAEFARDREALLNLLLQPRGYLTEMPAFPAANLLTRTEHVQLGYLNWSLWALPLIARHAGQDLIDRNAFATDIPRRLRVLCADAFALYTMGPSYPCAAIYLEFDPDDVASGGTSDAISDAQRAEVLLDGLPELARSPGNPEHQELDRRASQLRAAWQKARAAAHGGEARLAEDDQKVVRRLLDELRSFYPEMAYTVRDLSYAVKLAQILAAETPLGEDAGKPQHRELLVAMWWSRLDYPRRCPQIHQRARELASRSGPASQSLTRYGMERPG